MSLSLHPIMEIPQPPIGQGRGISMDRAGREAGFLPDGRRFFKFNRERYIEIHFSIGCTKGPEFHEC